MNSDALKAVLNIPSENSWEECSGIRYERLHQGSEFIYPLLRDKIRIALFSGDTDGQVPMIGATNWLEFMGWNITETWRPYMLDEYHVGGYIQRRAGIDHFSIHGTGHMAPQWKRSETKFAIEHWINEVEFPKQK